MPCLRVARNNPPILPYQSYVDAATNATNCQSTFEDYDCFSSCRRAAKRVLLEVHPDKFSHSFGCKHADHSRFGIAHELTLFFNGLDTFAACHARF